MEGGVQSLGGGMVRGYGPAVWSQGGYGPGVCPVGMVLRNMVPGGTALPDCTQKDTRL